MQISPLIEGMKPQIFFVLAVVCTAISCGFSPLQEQVRAVFPEPPAQWMLGVPCWRLEWYDPTGKLQSAEVSGNGADIEILTRWPNGILAWPYWPEKGLAAGMLYPAGAMYPLDAGGSSINLSWAGGIDACLYREMDKHRPLNTANRVPEYFDWKRFRALLRETAPEDLRADPWLADWKDIAERIVRSGFRQSLLKAEKRSGAGIVLPHDGPWMGASSFMPPQSWQEGEKVLLPLGARPEILICPGGMLSVSPKLQLWAPFP